MKTRNSHGLPQLGREALAYCQCASALISGNKALFASVDLIGEKNQVILEFVLFRHLVKKFVYLTVQVNLKCLWYNRDIESIKCGTIGIKPNQGLV